MLPTPVSKHYFGRYIRLIEYVKAHPQHLPGETHHILPVSMGGSDTADNLILLSNRLHFLAHWLLWKAYRNSKMTAAFHMMRHVKSPGQDRYQKITSKVYAKLKEDYSAVHHMKNPEIAAKISGDNSPSKTKQSRDARTGQNHFSAKPDYVCKTAGDKHHMKRPEVVAKNAGANHYTKQLGWVSPLTGENNPSCRPESRDRMKGDNNPAKRSEVKEKMSLNGSMRRPDVVAKITGENHYSHKEGFISKKKGRADIKVTCPHCSKEGGQSNMKRWHFDKCKYRLTNKTVGVTILTLTK